MDLIDVPGPSQHSGGGVLLRDSYTQLGGDGNRASNLRVTSQGCDWLRDEVVVEVELVGLGDELVVVVGLGDEGEVVVVVGLGDEVVVVVGGGLGDEVVEVGLGDEVVVEVELVCV
ncbi:unnamed protein product [Boreogadus saida]